jgi:hypothetical protein
VARDTVARAKVRLALLDLAGRCTFQAPRHRVGAWRAAAVADAARMNGAARVSRIRNFAGQPYLFGMRKVA